MTYPAAISQFCDPFIIYFTNPQQAQSYYKARTGNVLPPYDPNRPYQPWMESRAKPSSDPNPYAGYAYNFLYQDEKGWYRMESDTVPYITAMVPNIPDGGVPPNQVYLAPMRKLGKTPSGGYEVIATSPFGVEVVSSDDLADVGLLNVPPDVLAAIKLGQYVPPGI